MLRTVMYTNEMGYLLHLYASFFFILYTNEMGYFLHLVCLSQA